MIDGNLTSIQFKQPLYVYDRDRSTAVFQNKKADSFQSAISLRLMLIKAIVNRNL